MTKDEKKWRAENDLYTLMEAEKIKADKTRLNLAKKYAKIVADEKMREVKAVKKLAKPTKKSVTKNRTNRKIKK